MEAARAWRRTPKKRCTLRKAAEQGYANAQYILGVCYLYGEGVAKDLKSARRWLREAAAQGDQRAMKLLNRSDIWR